MVVISCVEEVMCDPNDINIVNYVMSCVTYCSSMFITDGS